MMFDYSLDELLAILPPVTSEGTLAVRLTGIASLERAGPADISFLSNPKYRNAVAGSRAGAILLPRDFEGTPRAEQVYLRTENPSYVLARLCEHAATGRQPDAPPGVHPSASVASGAQVAESASIGPYVVVGEGARIDAGAVLLSYVSVGERAVVGAGSWIHPRVTLYPDTVLGERVLVHAGVVLGSDGFGYETIDGVHTKIPQIGRVVVEDEVEIGANTCIDRARFEETRIGRGTKIDNLVQIGHNVTIGKHCLIVSQTGISGSTRIDDSTTVGGQCGIAGHIHIGAGSVIGAKSGVSKNLPAGSFVNGTPATPIRENYRLEALRRKLPELFQRVTELEEALRRQEPE